MDTTQKAKAMLRAEPITKITSTNIKEIRALVQDQLDELGGIYGLKLQLHAIKFDGLSFKTSLKGTVIAPSSGDTAEEALFKRDCHRVGLPTSAYGKEIETQKGMATIVGVNPRAYRYPVQLQLKSGERLKVSLRYVT